MIILSTGNYFLRLIASPALVGLIFVIVGTATLKYPPKNINSTYGYRTELSMINQDTWSEANTFSSILLLKYGIALIVIGIVISFLTKYIVAITTATIGVTIIFSIMLIDSTEKRLEQTFDKNGIRKNK